jgi:release factor family 10
MTQPMIEDARELSGWQPPFGVLSVYLRFDPGDRSGAWRTELRNGVERAIESAAEGAHARRMALRATARRLLDRFDGKELRPPPLGEAGFVEVSESGGRERWWGSATPPRAAAVTLGERPAVAPLVELCGRAGGCGIAVLSAERVRLLRFAEGQLHLLTEWELSITSGDWRERKAPSSGASGHDQYGERLEHNRRRFLAECGRLTGERLRGDGCDEVIAFGPKVDAECFQAGLGPTAMRAELGADADLISMPDGQLGEKVAAAVERLESERERELVTRALGGEKGGSRGAVGPQETEAALAEGRVEHLVLDADIGAPAEALVREALAGGAEITVVGNGLSELLESAEGVAAVLRY